MRVIRLLRPVAAAFLTLAAASCTEPDEGAAGGGGPGGSGDAVQSCDRKATAGICTDYTGDGWTEDEKARGCPQGMLQIVPCSSAGAVGACLVQPDAPDELRVTYYADGYPAFTPDTAQSACASQQGLWEP